MVDTENLPQIIGQEFASTEVLVQAIIDLQEQINALSGGGSVDASSISFDPSGTALTATNVQDAIEEIL